MPAAVKRGHRPGLGDPLLEDLAGAVLPVGQEEAGVDRLVLLAEGRVDLGLGEQGVETEGPPLVGDDRHDPLADAAVLDQVAQQPGEGAGGRGLHLLARPRQKVGERVARQRRQRRLAHHPLGVRPVEGAAPGPHVLELLGLRAGVVVGRVALLQHLVGDVEEEPVTERLQLRFGHLLDLVRGVAGLELGAERPAFDGVGQDDRRAALVLGRGLVGGVDLAVVVPAPGQLAEVVVGEVLDELAQPGVGAEEVLPDVGARLHRVLLELAVAGRVHLVDENAVDVALEQVVPLPAPDDLDDVPAAAPEGGLELLDDLAVAPHRPVEPLQVAVDDEDQVVELLVGGEVESRPSTPARPSRRRRRSTTPWPWRCRRSGGAAGSG